MLVVYTRVESTGDLDVLGAALAKMCRDLEIDNRDRGAVDVHSTADGAVVAARLRANGVCDDLAVYRLSDTEPYCVVAISRSAPTASVVVLSMYGFKRYVPRSYETAWTGLMPIAVVQTRTPSDVGMCTALHVPLTAMLTDMLRKPIYGYADRTDMFGVPLGATMRGHREHTRMTIRASALLRRVDRDAAGKCTYARMKPHLGRLFAAKKVAASAEVHMVAVASEYFRDHVVFDPQGHSWAHDDMLGWTRSESYVRSCLRTVLIGAARMYADDPTADRPQREHADEFDADGVVDAIGNHAGGEIALGRLVRGVRCACTASEFEDVLDESEDVIGTDNGVLDLVDGRVRPSRPDDMVSMSVGYMHFPDVNEQRVAEVLRIIATIYPDAHVRAYVMDVVIPTIMERGNTHRFMYIWSGYGSNGKSVMSELITSAMGDYACVLPTTTLTGKRTGADNATPALSRLRGKRVAFMHEPSHTDRIDSGNLKSMTGKDMLYVRDLYKSGTHLRVDAVLVLICNGVVQIPNADVATISRLRVVPHTSVFAVNAGAGQYEMDPGLSNKIPAYRSAMLHIMTRAFAEYKSRGRTVTYPDVVRRHTETYVQTVNVCYHFVSSRLVPARGSSIRFDAVYESFKAWHETKSPHRVAPDAVTLSSQLGQMGYREVDGVLTNAAWA